VGGNAALKNDSLVIGNSSVNVFSNSSVISVGGAANVQANGFVVGSTTINATAINLNNMCVIDSAVGITVGNSSVNAFANSTIFKIGIITSNTTAIGVGSNVFMDSAQIFLGNSSVNAIGNQFGWSIGTTVVNSTSISVGSNVAISAGGILLGNASVNTSITSTGISVNGKAILPATIDIGFALGDGTNVITTGFTGRYLGPFDYGGTILGWSIIGQESGSVSIDVLKTTYTAFDAGATHPSVAADKISATAPITLSSATKNQGSPTGWTANTFAAGDIFAFNVSSATTSKLVTVFLKVLKTS
jgi:hypothetical protein